MKYNEEELRQLDIQSISLITESTMSTSLCIRFFNGKTEHFKLKNIRNSFSLVELEIEGIMDEYKQKYIQTNRRNKIKKILNKC